MSQFTTGNVPGFQAAVEGDATQLAWSGRQGHDQIVTQRAIIHEDTEDAANTPVTTLRAGVVLAYRDADGKMAIYSPGATDGTQIAIGVLEQAQDMLVGGVATERFTQMIVHGLVREGLLHDVDPRARLQLGQQLLFDRKPLSMAPLLAPRGIYRKSTNYTITAADNGLMFLATAAATFTLPTKANGLAFRVAQTADNDLVISGSSDIIHKGNAAANTVTFNTASQKIGSSVLIECVYTGSSTLKWLVTNLGGTTATVA
jgi:hypothetical protein